MQLYYNAVDMRAMLKQECANALQFVVLLDRHFNMLGQQVVNSLCRNGVMTPTGHRLYQPQKLTLALIGTHSSIIWELNRTLKASMPTMVNYSRLANTSYYHRVNHTTAPITTATTPSDSICPRCRDKPDPNCWVHNPTHHLIPPN